MLDAVSSGSPDAARHRVCCLGCLLWLAARGLHSRCRGIWNDRLGALPRAPDAVGGAGDEVVLQARLLERRRASTAAVAAMATGKLSLAMLRSPPADANDPIQAICPGRGR